jgi:hypothetical protein
MVSKQKSQRDIEGADVTAPRMVDVQDALIGREGEPVRGEEIVGQERHGAEIGRYPEYAGKGQVPQFIVYPRKSFRVMS